MYLLGLESVDLGLHEAHFLLPARHRERAQDVGVRLRLHNRFHILHTPRINPVPAQDVIHCKVVRYDDIRSRQLIKNYFDMRILNAYDKLIPGPFKSDI